MKTAKNVTVTFNGILVNDGNYQTLQLASLKGETFKSHTNNALKENSVAVVSNSLSITVPALSTTAILLQSVQTNGVNEWRNKDFNIKIFPIPAENELNISTGAIFDEPTQITVFDQQGRKLKVVDTNFNENSAIKVDISSLQQGYYFLSLKSDHYNTVKSFVLKR